VCGGGRTTVYSWITTNEPIHENKNVGWKVKLSWNLAHTVPSQVGHSFEGNGFWKSKDDGICTNSARLLAMASATDSAVAFSPLKMNKLKNI